MYFNQKEIEFMLEQYYGKMMKDEKEELLSEIVPILINAETKKECLCKLEKLYKVDTCLDWYEWNRSVAVIQDMVENCYESPRYIKRVDFIATVRHLAWCCYRMAVGETYNMHETEEQHKSLVDGVVFAINHPDASAKDNHNHWMKYKTTMGWTYGEEYSLENKKHPSIKEFEKLSMTEQTKDVMDLEITKAASYLYDSLLNNMRYFADVQNALLNGKSIAFEGWEDGIWLRYEDNVITKVNTNIRGWKYETWDYKELMKPGWYIL